MTDKERLVFRRKDGPTYADKELNKYLGKLVECSGFIVGYSFLADKIKIVEDET